MASVGLRDQDRLDGASDFGVWKAIISLLLEENGIKEYVTTVVTITTDATQLATYKKDDSKVRRLILDGVKDHIAPHIAELDTPKKMWDAILNLYQNATTNWKLILGEKLMNTRMNKGEDVTSYLTILRLVKDELVAIGDKPSDDELVRIALNGFSKQWDVFVQVVNGRYTLPSWDQLWSNFTQEELRLSLVNGANNKSQKSEAEHENLVGKGKAKKGYLLKIKCYGCHEFGYYVSDWLERKKNDKKGRKQVAASASADELSNRMEDEFALIACMVSSTS